MLKNTTWLVAALAAALWMSPAAAQTGSTSTGREHTYGTGNGTDPTRSNTDPDQSPVTSPDQRHATERGEATQGQAAPGATSERSPGATSTGTTPADTDTSSRSGAKASATGSAASQQGTADIAQTLETLHQGNQQEIAAGNLMQQQAQNSKVRDFAKKMVKDHSKLDKDVTSFAQKKGVDLGAAGPVGTQHLDELRSMSGPQADRAYMDMMVEDHQRDVNEVRAAERQAKSAHQKDLASLLDKSAKKMESHLKDAQKIQRELSQRQARAPNQ